MSKIIEAIIFDLDGVIVDTAKYHFLAWKELAMSLKIPFDENDNEQLKGVSRIQSLEYILNKAELNLTPLEKEKLATMKNLRYLDHITTIDTTEMLPGVIELLKDLRANDIKIALGSASKNASFILDRLGITHYFDVVVDGNMTKEGKPSPETFLLAAHELNLPAENCLVVEDAAKGVEAAIAANMWCLGIGDTHHLSLAHWVRKDLIGLSFSEINKKIQSLQMKS